MNSRRRLVRVVVACGSLLAAAVAFGSDLETRLAALEEIGLADPARAVVELEALDSQVQPADRAHWLTRLALERNAAGDAAGARQDAARLRTLADPLAETAALLALGSIERTRGSAPAAWRLLTAASHALPASGPDWLRFPLVSTRARAAEAVGKTEDAVVLYQQAIDLADRMGMPSRQSIARQYLAWLYTGLGEHDSARRLVDSAREFAMLDGSAIVRSRLLNVESYRLAELGDRAGARAAQLEALALARTAGAKRAQALMLANLADDFLRDGDYGAALAHAQEALPLARALHDPSALSVALINRGFARVMLRQFSAGAEDIETVLALEERNGNVAQMARLLQESGTYFERAGELRAAWSAYARLRPLAERVSRKEQQEALLGLQEGFEHKQRERELKELAQAREFEEATLQAQSLKLGAWLLAALAGALALALLGGLVLRARRTNQALAVVNADLQRLGEQDALTGLANRRCLQRVMKETDADASLDGSIFLVDIDHFKRVNDLHGHAIGDMTLVAVARRLQNAVRSEDLVVRWGGEEFLVLARGIGADEVRRLAQRMLDSIADSPVTQGDAEIKVSVSVGYARFPIEPGPLPVHWEQAIELIDAAMYLAKAHGRNRGYGIVDLQATNARELSAIATSLESSREHGRVGLQALQGPVRSGAEA